MTARPVVNTALYAEYTSPAQAAETVTPSDSINLSSVCRGLWVGGAGNAAVVMADGSVVTYSGILAGTLLPVMISRVNLTNTTATLMVAMY